jgi:ribosomal protein S21
MNARVVVGEGEAVRVALIRLKHRMGDGGVFTEMMIHSRFESHGAKRRLKRILARQRRRDREAWEKLGFALPDCAQ